MTTDFKFTWKTVEDMIFAGHATFTILNTETNNHFTYRIRKPDKMLPRSGVWWVWSKDENGGWHYLFSYFDDPNDFSKLIPKITGRSAIKSWDHIQAKAILWYVNRLRQRRIPKNVVIQFADHCCRCGRQLTDPKSLDRGIGPECVKVLGLER